MTSASIPDDVWREFYFAQTRAYLLMGNDIYEYLEKIRNTVFDTDSSGYDSMSLAESARSRADARKWLYRQLSESRDVFRPYLSVAYKHK